MFNDYFKELGLDFKSKSEKFFSYGFYPLIFGIFITIFTAFAGIVIVADIILAGKSFWLGVSAGIIEIVATGYWIFFSSSFREYLSKMTIPVNYFGIREILGKRFPGVLQEGFHLVLPWNWIEKVEIFSLEPIRLEDEVNGITGGDSLEIIVDFGLEYKSDSKVLNARGEIPTFSNYEKSVVETGIIDELKEKINIICGARSSNAEDIVTRREEFSLFINSWVRLPEPPHAKDNKSPEETLDYYKSNREAVNNLLAHEEERNDERSKIEVRYGIDIIKVNIKKIAFSEKTMKALELKKQMEEEKKANEKLLDMVESSAKRLGISSGKAIDMILTVINPAKNTKNRIYSFSNLDKILSAIANLKGGGK